MTSSIRNRKRGTVAVVATAALALVLSACGDSGSGDGGGDSTDGGGDSTAEAIDCAPYEAFGDLDGTTVSIYTSIVEPESDQQIASYKPFEDCTGVTIDYEGSREFEAQLLVRIQAGDEVGALQRVGRCEVKGGHGRSPVNGSPW